MPREKRRTEKSPDTQPELFEMDADWEAMWAGMSEFKQEDRSAFAQAIVSFKDREAQERFYEMMEEKIGVGIKRTPTLWFPPEKIDYYNRGKKARPENVDPNKYPIYIISKGRAKGRKTSKALDVLGIPHRIVVEPQEFEEYAATHGKDRLLVLPFSNLGKGSIPARNWVWEHSIEEGHERHWILDDNINGFWRLLDNLKLKVLDLNPFAPVEEFTDRFENVGMSGMNYFMFASRKSIVPPFYLNTRIYSCILLDNRITHRWRGIYNEDTDLSLRILKDGMCTVLMNAFLAEKTTTMTMKGGNTDELYKQDAEMDGRRLMAESLREQHPDVVTITHKWGRWHHQVDYRPFKRNRLLMSDSLLIQEELRRDDPWRLLVACVLLNKTTGKAVRKVLWKVLNTWPDARSMSCADKEKLADVVRGLGFQNRRARTLRKMSLGWEELKRKQKSSENPPTLAEASELAEIGKYAQDSYRIFVLGEDLSSKEVEDKELVRYLERKEEIEERYADWKLLFPGERPEDAS